MRTMIDLLPIKTHTDSAVHIAGPDGYASPDNRYGSTRCYVASEGFMAILFVDVVADDEGEKGREKDFVSSCFGGVGCGCG
jgi:hypothetical protein